MENITISDQFQDPQGRFRFYDAYEEPDRLHIIDQSHVDIRSFINSPRLTKWRMLNFDQSKMGLLNTLDMAGLEDTLPYRNGESWSAGTVGKQGDRNNWNGLSLSCAGGGVTTTTQSVIPVINIDAVDAVDLLTGFDDNDFISLALPDFPLSSINTTQSWIDFTSNPTGDFAAGPVASLRLADSIIPLVGGNSEYRKLRGSLDGIDVQQITGVRFRIEANTACTFRAMALRLLGKNWAYTDLDFNTLQEIIEPTVSPNGSISRVYDFNFPILFRSGIPAGDHNPKPIDLSVSTVFNTGSKTRVNQIRLYFREGPGDYTTQLDLNTKTMAELDGLPQPNITFETYRSRTQRELDKLTQLDLKGDTQLEIERTVDPEIASYLSATVRWTETETEIILIDSEGSGHTFPALPAMLANTPYIFIVDSIGKTMRARIYPTDQSGNILVNDLIFDTTIIYNDFVFTRRAGRFGWAASLLDGDAYIDNISTRRQVYAELQTASYQSLTPVIGAELHVSGSEQVEYFDQLDVANFIDSNLTITRDYTNSTTGSSWRINNPGTRAIQGVVTNLADFYDFDEMEISFDLYYPSQMLKAGVGLEAYLSNNQGRIIPIPIGKIITNRWQRFTLSPGGKNSQTGRYSFYLVQNGIGIPSTWWVDNIRIRERSLSFYARSIEADPWGDADSDWIPFRNSLNRSGSGVQFLERGRSLTILGKAHRQSSHIDNLKVVPNYAQLGRFIWEGDELYNPQPPTALFTATPYGRTIVFNGTSSTDPDGNVINYHWNFGDGEIALGPIVSHTYRIPGFYTPSLVITDSNGLQDSTNELMFVTNA